MQSAGQFSSQDGISIHTDTLSIRKYPKAAPQYAYHAPSRDPTHLIRLEGRTLGEAEDFHEVLESALDTFKNLQLSASRNFYYALPSRFQGLSSTQTARPTNIVGSQHDSATSQRRSFITRTTIGPSAQYATATVSLLGSFLM